MLGLVKWMLVAAILCCQAAWCAPPAIAIPTGNVTLNGVALLRASAVVLGDLLIARADSAIVLQAKASSIQLAPNSQCRVQEHGFTLNSGTARVRGTTAVISGENTFIGSSKSIFVVRRSRGNTIVTAVQGTIEIQHGKVTEQLSVGQTRTLAEVPTIPAAPGTPLTPPPPSASTNPSAPTTPVAQGRGNYVFAAFALGDATAAIIASHLGSNHPACISSGGSRCDFPSH